MLGNPEFSKRFRFADWPNNALPVRAFGVYAIWNEEQLVYCGMSGRGLNLEDGTVGKPGGLMTRLRSHASGRLSGDQFCVYVANRLVVPTLSPTQLALFADGAVNLDKLTKIFIHQHFDYQFAVVGSQSAAYDLEARCRQGEIFGSKPLLNPA